MSKPAILLIYGYDDAGPVHEIDATRYLVNESAAALRSLGWAVNIVRIQHSVAECMRTYDPRTCVVFNMCEGAPHQPFYYAQVAKWLDKLGFLYTGSGEAALDKTQYKTKMKAALAEHGVPTPAWGVIHACDRLEDLNFASYPAIVKPADEHCSYGITRDSVVTHVSAAHAQIAHLQRIFPHQPILIEEFLDSDEFNVSVWGNAAPQVFGISTMTYHAFSDIHDRLCTFDAKWTPESEAYQKIPAICPAPISAQLKTTIERVALDAYAACASRDYGRIDLRLKNDQPMVFDVNVNCDISPEGGFANAARAAGFTYAQMLERLFQIALDRGVAR
jgi:D-alanine-D-alanine ligase